MKRKLLYVFLGAEAVLLTALCLSADVLPEWFSSAAAFPFEQIAAVLGMLSGMGSVGEGAAAALYVAVCLAPLTTALLRGCGKREGVTLGALGIVLLVVLYFMANPQALRLKGIGDIGAGLPVLRGILGLAAWSAVLCCVVLQLLRLFRRGGMQQLMKYSRVMLYALCAMFVGVIFLPCLGQLLRALDGASFADAVVGVVRFAVSALPYAMNILITLCAVGLLDACLNADGDIAGRAQKLAGLCCLSLAVVTVSCAAFNLLQLLFMEQLSNVSVTLDIPLFSLAFSLAVLLAARLIAENKRLSDDNELFI